MSEIRKALDVVSLPLSGLHLIEASAGTGKTYTITSLVVRLVVEREISIDKIAAVTFTKAATSELKERVARRLIEAKEVLRGEREADGDPLFEHLLSLPRRARAEQRLARAVIDVDRAGIFTIHAFAARMLKEHSFESASKEGSELAGDPRPVVQDVVVDFWSSRIATLSEDEFRAVGSSSFYRVLQKIGAKAAGAAEVPLVSFEKGPDRAEVQVRLKESFSLARVSFEKEGNALLQRLLEDPGLNRNKMKLESLRKDYANYCEYFEAGVAGLGHPETDRFTQEKVLSSLKKKATPLDDPLLASLGELRELTIEAKKVDSLFADGLRYALCSEIAKRVEEEHERAGTQSFDGLLLELARALRDAESGPRLALEIRAAFPVALIDEFQDTDPLQFEIFSRIYETTSSQKKATTALYFIGDPKQSIYAFRGAELRTYLKAAQSAASSVWTLSTSYRASPRLAQAQNTLFGGPREPFAAEQIVYDEVRARPGALDELTGKEGAPLPGIQLIEFSGTAKEGPAYVAREVAAFLASGAKLGERKVSPGDIAVLARTNRAAARVQEELRQLHVPAVLHGDRSVFDTPEAFELRRILRALAEPAHRNLFRTALATRTLGVHAEGLSALDEDVEALEMWSTRFRSWGDLWRKRGVTHALSSLHTAVQFQARTLRSLDGERRMTNFRHLMELLHEAESDEHLGASGLIRWLDSAIYDPDSQGMAADGRQLRLESDGDAVTLTTAHRSKGLEYNIVFLPSLSDADRKADGDEAFRYFDQEQMFPLFEMRSKDNRGDSNEIARREGREESLRLAYVALTRAKHHAVVFYSEGKSFSPLAYLLHEAQGPEGGTDTLGAYLGSLDSSERQRQIFELCDKSEGALSFALAREVEVTEFLRSTDEVTLHRPGELSPLAESERTNSFSAMTRNAPHGLSRAAREGKDVDEESENAQFEGILSPDDPEPQLTLSTLSEFPRGAVPGDALHAAFEHSAFGESNAAERAPIIARELSKRGFSELDVEALQKNVEEVLAVELSMPDLATASPCTLGGLGPEQRVAEMEFGFAVGNPEHRLSASRLARALGYQDDEFDPPQQEGTMAEFLSTDYVKSVSRLPFSAWCGFLRGFIDLTIEHEGRLYILDYKSNFLGPHREDYSQARLKEAMEEHHYFLQALFYSVAIHRYGKLRIPDYSYERHFGGVHYLFVRGMHPQHGDSGVYSFRPSEELIDSLEAALASKIQGQVGGEAA